MKCTNCGHGMHMDQGRYIGHGHHEDSKGRCVNCNLCVRQPDQGEAEWFWEVSFLRYDTTTICEPPTYPTGGI